MGDDNVQSGSYTSAIAFAVLTVFCVAVTIAYVLTPNQESSAIVMGIIVLFLGNVTFNSFEKASAPGPPPQEFHDIDTFISNLANGTEVTFVIEIQFTTDKPSPSALSQIKYRILRRLNETLPLLDVLYEQPLPKTDFIVQKDIPDLCKELKLKSLTLRTIEVKDGGARATHRPQGIFLGDRPV